MTSGSEIKVGGVPADFRWLATPVAVDLGGVMLGITAGARTDWFVDPGLGATTMNAPALVCALDGDFALAARVEVAFGSTFDAGALVLWHDECTWAKLLFEFSPQRQPMVVSVVTRGESDDCNSFAVNSEAVWLRVARTGNAHAFHASLDGHTWQFVRHFRLGADIAPKTGFLVQSPLGEGCSARFSEIAYASRAPGDLRNGE